LVPSALIVIIFDIIQGGVEYGYAVGVDDVLPSASSVSSYDYNYETEREIRESAQATNLAYPVMIPVMTPASNVNKAITCGGDWVLVKGRHWKVRQYNKESVN
jgi:hypothetical protein